MTIIDDIKMIQSVLPDDFDFSQRVKSAEDAQKMGATPIEICIPIIMDLEPLRYDRPDEYDRVRPYIGRLARHLQGKQRYVWEAIFPMSST